MQIMFKLIIAGGRDFNNYDGMSKCLDRLLKNINDNIEIVCGMFSDCYGECTKCHLGIVRPDDSCEFGERRATTHV